MLANDEVVMQSHCPTTLIPQSSAGSFSAPVISRPLKRKATQLLPSGRKRYLRRLSLRTCFDDSADNDDTGSDVSDFAGWPDKRCGDEGKDCPACEPADELARKFARLLDGQYIRTTKQTGPETDKQFLNTITHIKPLQVICLSRDECTRCAADLLQAKSLQRPLSGDSYLDTYFVQVERRGYSHDKRLCFGVCDGMRHDPGTFCRFCRQRIGPHHMPVGINEAVTLTHLESCRALPAGPRAALYNAFLHQDGPFYDCGARVDLQSKDIHEARLSAKSRQRRAQSEPRNDSARAWQELADEHRPLQGILIQPENRVRCAPSKATNNDFTVLSRLPPMPKPLPRPAQGPRLGTFESTDPVMMAAAHVLAQNTLLLAAAADLPRERPSLTSETASDTASEVSHNALPIITKPRARQRVPGACSASEPSPRVVQTYTALLNAAGLETLRQLHRYVPVEAAEEFVDELAKRFPGRLTVIEEHEFVGVIHAILAANPAKLDECAAVARAGAFAPILQPYNAVLKKAGIGSTAELCSRVQTGTEDTFVARLAKRFADDLTFVREFALKRAIKQLQTKSMCDDDDIKSGLLHLTSYGPLRPDGAVLAKPASFPAWSRLSFLAKSSSMCFAKIERYQA